MMTTIVGTAATAVLLYTGGPLDVPPPSGPCNVLYCLTQNGRLKSVAFLADNQDVPGYGEIKTLISITDIVNESEFLALGPQDENNPLRLVPIKVDDIGLTDGIIKCDAATCLQILGGLNNMSILHSVTPQGHIDHVAFCKPGENGTMILKFVINDQPLESDWTTACILSVPVEALQY
jgi:hypothetical protein